MNRARFVTPKFKVTKLANLGDLTVRANSLVKQLLDVKDVIVKDNSNP